MSTLKKLFGERLRLLRIQQQLTQEQLAEYAKLSVDFVSLIERGRSSPSFDSIEKLARALDVPIQDLFKFDDF